MLCVCFSCREVPAVENRGVITPGGNLGMVQRGEKGYGKKVGVANPERNLGVVYSGHGLPRKYPT